MRKILVLWIVLAVIICLALAVAVLYNLSLLSPATTKEVATAADDLFGWKFPNTIKFPSTGSVGGPLTYSSIRDPGGIPSGLPVRLKIPAIGVDSAIEDAMITPDGRMDVPVGSVNVAWFSLGPQPGQVGSAVIGGHYGISNNLPWVFYNLDKMNIGDKIYVVDDKNNTLAFVVRQIKSFDRNADATSVFSSSDGLAHLNLITCEGIWNQVNGTYPLRLVLFADALVQEEPIPAPVVFTRSLQMGFKGTDVITLQNFLIKKQLLVIPADVTKGFFGKLTQVALTNYQISANLPPTGFFGPLTRFQITYELEANPGIPVTGGGGFLPLPDSPPTTDTAIVAPPPGVAKTIIGFAKVLFATWQDSIISCLLLFALAVLIYKIVRRPKTGF